MKFFLKVLQNDEKAQNEPEAFHGIRDWFTL